MVDLLFLQLVRCGDPIVSETCLPAFERIWPGVMTIVELKNTSSLLLAEGVKPAGVTLCACAKPARAATINDEAVYMLDMMRRDGMQMYIWGLVEW